MKVGDRVEIFYPAHEGEKGVVSTIVERKAKPSLLRIELDSGMIFVCDETMIKPCPTSQS